MEAAPDIVDHNLETVQRRRGQLQKLEAGEGLTKLEKISLAEAALEDGVDVYLRHVQERYEASVPHTFFLLLL
jgi:hypothetical protein